MQRRLSTVTPCAIIRPVLMPVRPRTKGNAMARRHPRAVNEIVQIGVRLDEGLRRRIERVASHRGQSMNAEIVERLRRSFQSEDKIDDLIAQAIIEAYPDIADRIEERGYEARMADELGDYQKD